MHLLTNQSCCSAACTEAAGGKLVGTSKRTTASSASGVCRRCYVSRASLGAASPRAGGSAARRLLRLEMLCKRQSLTVGRKWSKLQKWKQVHLAAWCPTCHQVLRVDAPAPEPRHLRVHACLLRRREGAHNGAGLAQIRVQGETASGCRRAHGQSAVCSVDAVKDMHCWKSHRDCSPRPRRPGPRR